MGGNVERHIGDDDRDGAAIEAMQPGGNGMTHAARDVLAERDEARAQVGAVVVGLKSLVSVVQGYQQMPGFSLHPMVAAQIDSLAQTSISDYKSALEAYGREKVREGMQRAVDLYLQGIDAILADMETLK